MLAVDERNVADGLYQLGVKAVTDPGDDPLALIAFSTADLDLHQFMVLERQLDFTQYRLAQPGITEADYRLEGVSATSQVVLHFFSQCHGNIILNEYRIP